MTQLYSPHFISPSQDDMFNRGKVSIGWLQSDPPSQDEDIDTLDVTYEIEYTDNYSEEDTVWRTLRRRIPWETMSYEWIVGKMIKSKKVRLRIRTKSRKDETFSDWSISDTFSVNVFDLIAPVIVSPLPDKSYSDFVLIILDETLTRETYNQKVRYTLEYSSDSLSVDWTTIVANVPVGQNVVRWRTDSLTPASDYVLKLTARNTSTCQSATPSTPDQLATRYVFDIRIQHSGVFLIDTRPPKAVISIEGNTNSITNELDHIINIFAEDETTQVETVRLRDCDASQLLPLGRLDSISSSSTDLCPLAEIENSKEIPFSPKISFSLKNMSGFKKLEALLKDTGGNLSIQNPSQVFISFFKTDGSVSDFIVKQEDRSDILISDNQITTEIATFEVIYLGTLSGDLWIFDPFPRKIKEFGKEIVKLIEYNSAVYVFIHDTVIENTIAVDLSEVYLSNTGESILISPVKSDSNPTAHFQKQFSIVTAVAVFNDKMYVGFKNGELWSYDGLTWAKKTTFAQAINILTADSKFLYIGFENSANLNLYNASEFFTVSAEI